MAAQQVEPATTPPGTERGRRLPWWPLAVGAVAVVYACLHVRVAADVACDVGINAGATALGVAAWSLLVLGVDLVGVTLARLVPGRAEALLVALLLMVGSAWFLLAVTSPPDGYPSPVAGCADNVPEWWPSWLPGGTF